MDNFQNNKFLEESLGFFFHPIMQELTAELSVRLPNEFQTLFLKSCDLYNAKTSGSVYERVRTRDRMNGAEYFYNLLHMGVQEAIAATCYNFNSFAYYCELIRKNGDALIKSAKPSRPTTLGISAQKLIFEYEHFTLHSRIVLDRLNYFLNYFFLTDSRNLYRLYNDLSKRPNKDNEAHKFLKTIDEHRTFLDELISTDKSKRRTERDLLAHREAIQFVTTNIMAMPDGSIDILFIGMNDSIGDNGDLILRERFENLKKFVLSMLNSFFGF